MGRGQPDIRARCGIQHLRGPVSVSVSSTPIPNTPLTLPQVTIRVLGGLLSAHYLAERAGSPDPIYLERAEDLGNRLLSVFHTPSGLPTSKINLGKQVGVPDADNMGLVSTAEAATLQLELKYLSQLTGEESYWRAAENVMKVIKEAMRGGLAPIMMKYVEVLVELLRGLV